MATFLANLNRKHPLDSLGKLSVRTGHYLHKTLISPYLGSRCRFHPCCSDYFAAAVERHGTVKGSWLGIKRLVKCQPFHPGGIDPVP